MQLLGVRMDPVRRNRLGHSLARLLASGASHMVVTPNPEMLVHAQRFPEFKAILNRATLTVPDGIGLQYAARFLGKHIGERITGLDVIYLLAYLAVTEKKRMLLIGGGELGVAQEAARTLQQAFPALDVQAMHGSGITRLSSGRWHQDQKLVDSIRGLAPDILCVALGHGKQEHWIHDHLPLLPSVKIAVGVGGAFDYYAGRIRRASPWVRRLGFEWLARLFYEPRRLRRIIHAVIVFPILILHHR